MKFVDCKTGNEVTVPLENNTEISARNGYLINQSDSRIAAIVKNVDLLEPIRGFIPPYTPILLFPK